MTTTPPTVSVCIPSYNCERYAGAAIESVLAQTFTDYELLVVDDCSTDGTLDVVRRFDDPRIRLIEQPRNLGAGGNWNTALRAARGRFVKILCNDDLLHPACLERQVAVLSAPGNEGVAMVSCARDIIAADGRKLLTRRFPRIRGRVGGRAAVRRNVRAGTNLIGEPSAVLFRAEAAEGMVFREEMRYCIDLDFWYRLLLRSDLFVLPDSLSVFRVSAHGWSFRLAALQSGDFRKVIEEMAADATFGITAADMALGNLRALINMYLRRMFYRFVVRGS